MSVRQNVLILHADQLRYDGIGCCGNPSGATPHIDSLAADGVVFDRHIVSNPTCMPSRASLLTGLYPAGHNVWSTGVPLQRREYTRYCRDIGGDSMVVQPTTLADAFAASGYHTFSLGKLHLTPNIAPVECGFPETVKAWEDGRFDNWHGPYYGFEHVEMTKGHGEQPCRHGHYANWLREKHPDVHASVMGNYKNLYAGERLDTSKPIPSQLDLYPSPVPGELHNSAWLAERFEGHLAGRADKSKPFLAFVGFPDPHHPFTPSFDVLEKFLDAEVKDPLDPDGEALPGAAMLRRAHSLKHLTVEQRKLIIRYTYAMIHQVDLAVGRILRTLKEMNLWDDTIIVFTSDHGDFLGDHQALYKGYFGSDALLRVPFVIRVPGRNGGQRKAEPMSNCDVMPTLASLTGVKLPDPCHGRDIFAGGDEGEKLAFAYAADGDPKNFNLTVYDDRHRLTWYPCGGFVELYDHKKDPAEIRNVADEKGKSRIRAHLIGAIKDWHVRTSNPILSKFGLW
ncbi:MAG: sulfatase-like hydrolase/transferase [Victivallales bacterium]